MHLKHNGGTVGRRTNQKSSTVTNSMDRSHNETLTALPKTLRNEFSLTLLNLRGGLWVSHVSIFSKTQGMGGLT